MNQRWWAVMPLLLSIPLTAILHHLVFFRPTCILNNFGPDYTPRVLLSWVEKDPSPYLGLLLATIIWWVGRTRAFVRRAAAAFLVAFAPLSIWIWDVPFSGRVICLNFHDGRVPIHSRHLYLLGAALFAGLLLFHRMALRRRTGAQRRKLA